MATLPPLADLDALGARTGVDYTDAHGEPTVPEGVKAQAALEDASALVRSVTAPEDWVDEHGELEDVPPVIETITLQVAQRSLLNPQGAVQASVGDVSVTYSRGDSAGSMFLTSSEVRALRKAAGVMGVSSFQLVTEFIPPNGRDQLYAEVEGGGDPIPIGPIPWED